MTFHMDDRHVQQFQMKDQKDYQNEEEKQIIEQENDPFKVPEIILLTILFCKTYIT